MSDIYLQITETPTVVTLSAPVISGALTSTVTVANVVTVALDSNSLSALENVTVTVGAAITGTVTVSNFPASQAVTFSAVSISNLPSTQTIAGTVTVGTLPSIANNTDFVLVGENLAEGFNNYGVFGVSVSNLYTATQTIAGSVTLGASTAQIGSVTASNITGLNNSVGTDGGTPASTNFVKIGGHQDGSNSVEHIVHVSAGGSMKVDASDSTVTFGTIRGTVTIGNSVTIGSLPALVAGTAQIGSVTASISNSVTIASLPAISGAVTANGFDFNNSNYSPIPLAPFDENTGGGLAVVAKIVDDGGAGLNFSIGVPISGTVTANTFALQGTAVTTSNFTSTTASTVLAGYNATREVLTIFNEGAGNLHICAGATCTTIAYQVRLSAGDYYEVPNHQTTITHSAVFATAGTARVTQVS